MLKFFDHTKQLDRIRHELNKRFSDVLEKGQFIQGSEVREVEHELANYLGIKHCISTSNGSDALLAALMAIGVAPGDEVITPAFSYIAAAESIKLLGATPVYIDVDRHTFNLDSSQLKVLINTKTKAIIAIDLFGQSADYDAIFKAVEGTDIIVIEDAAQSFGAQYRNRKAGTLADIATTSFFPTKPLGCFGDGGAIFTDNPQLAQALREITQHGQSEKYHHHRVGINGRLDTLQAAVLLEKLPFFDQDIGDRKEAANFYDELIFEYLSTWNIKKPLIEEHNQSVYAQYTISTEHRDKLQKILGSAGIPTAIHYPIPVYNQWHNKPVTRLPVTEELCSSVISLPFYPAIPRNDQLKVIKAISTGLRQLTPQALYNN